MIYYLNLGFVLEQALVDVTKTYIERLHLDSVYNNFHIQVVNEHPFAHMMIEDNTRAGDTFPAVVITSQTDSEVPDLANMMEISRGVKVTSQDLDELFRSAVRPKTKINEKTGETEIVRRRDKSIVMENVPGYVLIYDEERINQLKAIADSRTVGEEPGGIYGIKIDSRRRDNISVEIWCENDQLKDELYEHLNLFFTCSLDRILQEKFKMFECAIFGNKVSGERSSNYNYDFDVLLSGSHLTFSVDYNVSQIILDTDIENITTQIFWEVFNHVKTERS
ncbi:MAG: hypothetical protein J6T31_07210 [Methanobrevibacter sp.]|nr:hypothetical protein [Methanobrevibacter sp.]